VNETVGVALWLGVGDGVSVGFCVGVTVGDGDAVDVAVNVGIEMVFVKVGAGDREFVPGTWRTGTSTASEETDVAGNALRWRIAAYRSGRNAHPSANKSRMTEADA